MSRLVSIVRSSSVASGCTNAAWTAYRQSAETSVAAPRDAGCSSTELFTRLAEVEVAIEVGDLRMRYGDNDVLTGVDFDVRTDEVVCLLGPNGAGKTTTIEILEGFRIRSGGQVSVLGQDPAHADEDWRARTGVVLQSWRDHPRWTPRRLLTLLGGYYKPYSTPGRPRPYDVEELLDTVGLTELADRKLTALSTRASIRCQRAASIG